MASRRERFREAMARLNPAGNPARAIERGMYVERPGRSAVQVISARLELDPSASFLLVSGVGSGKTTELLMTEQKLNALDDVHAFYMDVSTVHDIRELKPGILIAVAGIILAERITGIDSDEKALQAKKELLKIANGFSERVGPQDDDPFDDDGDNGWRYHSGAVKEPRRRALNTVVEHRSLLLQQMCAPLLQKKPHLVLIFDSLDRIHRTKELNDLIWEDVEALHRVGIAVVLTGPLQIMYGESGIMVQRFFQDRVFLQTTIDVWDNQDGIDFLRSILELRLPQGMISHDVFLALIKAFGGVLRDLIALAHTAIQEVYVAGGDCVQVAHVDRAAWAFGRQFMLSLNSNERSVLRYLQETGRFDATTPTELRLLATQRVLVVSTADGDVRYAIHPTVELLLGPLEEAS